MHGPITTEILKLAYANGLFPMADPQTGEVSWFRPDPRAILPLDSFHCSHSLKRRIKQHKYKVTFNNAFATVMDACANREETWISEELKQVYQELHQEGAAHSVEIWQDGALVGGTYGVSLGGAFFAESKFHKTTDASKLALYHLVEHLKDHGFVLLEVQFLTPHLARLGAIEIPGSTYQKMLSHALTVPAHFPSSN